MISLFKQRKRTLRGFTLVELLVSAAIFSTVLIISIGALFSAQAINTRLQETQIILDGVNLATEVMSRDIRYGAEFHCESAFPLVYATSSRLGCVYPGSPGTVIVFKPAMRLSGTTDATQDRVSYSVQDVTYGGITRGVLIKQEYPFGAEPRTFQVTPSDVNIQSLTFFTHGAHSSSGAIDVGNAFDYDQPTVTISISGITVPSKTTVPPVTFNIQTSVSARGIDN
jgi:prepilin-type N-terminal cleavage/methylation domain-containing protein